MKKILTLAEEITPRLCASEKNTPFDHGILSSKRISSSISRVFTDIFNKDCFFEGILRNRFP